MSDTVLGTLQLCEVSNIISPILQMPWVTQLVSGVNINFGCQGEVCEIGFNFFGSLWL